MAQAKKLLSNQPTTPKLEEEEEEEEDPEEDEESSGEGEEEEEEEEESDGEEQKEKPKTPENKASQEKQKPTIVEKHKAACEGSGEEEDEEELEEAPHSPSASDFTIKLITPKNPKSKDSKPTSKRPSETSKSDEKEELRRKKKAKVSEEDLKKEKCSGSGSVVGPGRVWSEEDEIRVLQGMIDYQKKKGVDPSADMAAFHDFVKGKLQAEVTRTQLYEKHRRLKQKYSKNMVKSEKGEALAFSKPHDTKIYDLSKRVWGVEKISNGVDEIENVNGKTDGGKVKKSRTVKAKKDAKLESKNIVKEEVNDDDVDEGDFEKKYPFTNEAFSSLVGLIGSHQVSLLKAKLSVVGNATSREFEGNWKKLVEQESDIVAKKLRMFSDQTERVMDESRRN